jgi:hypothetical protein
MNPISKVSQINISLKLKDVKIFKNLFLTEYKFMLKIWQNQRD